MNRLRLFLLTFGVFGIINTEQGIVGLLPLIVVRYGVSVPTAGLLVSLFAPGIALSGATHPPLLSGIDRKKVMELVLGVFLACTPASAFAPNFAVAFVARVVPAFSHPVYIHLLLPKQLYQDFFVQSPCVHAFFSPLNTLSCRGYKQIATFSAFFCTSETFL